jgi:hypothetical protein
MKYKILSFIVWIIIWLLISFGYSKIFDSDSKTQINNFWPEWWQFSWSWRFMNEGKWQEERMSWTWREIILGNEGEEVSNSWIIEESWFDKNTWTWWEIE